ncbi:hypothetical protein Tsubulata_037028 [Turnera subulata]|uniref:Uncharacterized protein n=1 Tax=Turnera subulata TaxID=218843 RepID=A0A9Q0GL08_9ROSI|nr:hypothetical protein Tsubulata_037028 [Turnera subulata]
MAGQETTSKSSYSMSSGDGPNSYPLNSNFQRGIVEAAKEPVRKAIQDSLELTTISNDTFAIADFGCSIGSNTLIATQNIIEAVKHKYHDRPPLEFQVFFNDLVNNDFNTLFRNLPPSPEFFAAGVPGAFQNRLFPKASLHIGFSSYALHWISKVPEEVVDSNSSAWNKDSIHCTGFSKEVAMAFSAQFRKDMENFLNARAQELVGGGLLVIAMPGLPEGTPCSQTYYGVINDIMGYCLLDMVKEGLISEEKLQSFNLPMYYPPINELEAVLERNADFTIEKIDPSFGSNTWIPTTPSLPKLVTSLARGIMGEIVKEYFGIEIMDSIFERYHKKLLENLNNYADIVKPLGIFVILKRKAI